MTNDEFNEAYHGIPGDLESTRRASDNRNIIRAVLRKYSYAIADDDLESCGTSALWRTLQYHRAEFGQKFTTSLHRFTHWECRRELRKSQANNRRRQGRIFVSIDDKFVELSAVAVTCDDNEDVAEHVRECVKMLPEDFSVVISQYFFGHLTMEAIGKLNGYSKETARQRLKKAVVLLRDICLTSLEPDGVLGGCEGFSTGIERGRV